MFLSPILHAFVSTTERHATLLKYNFILRDLNLHILQFNYPYMIKKCLYADSTTQKCIRGSRSLERLF